MDENSKILVLGGTGLVGSAICRELEIQGFQHVLAPTRQELNLYSQQDVLEYFHLKKPEYIFMAAAKVGGIQANNTCRADFIHQNLQIQSNVFDAAWRHTVKRLLFLGSSCIYPKECPQPIREEYLLTGPLEQTNEPYAIAKIAGLKTAESFNIQYGCPFYSLMPTNLYGPNDNFDPETSHVIPGLISRMHSAKISKKSSFSVWGSGNPLREFLYVDDLAKACVFVMKLNKELPHWLNVGTGKDLQIKELAKLIKEVVGFQGQLVFDDSKPDGTFRKILDISKIQKLGWRHETDLAKGLELTYEAFLSRD